MIIDKLKTNLLQARKSKDQWLITFYSTLVGEIEAIGKSKGNRQTTDEECQKHMKTWYVNNDATLVHVINEKARNEIVLENFLLKEYLPETLSEDVLKEIIKELVVKYENKQGLVMKALKETYPNQYDGKVASDIFKELTK